MLLAALRDSLAGLYEVHRKRLAMPKLRVGSCFRGAALEISTLLPALLLLALEAVPDGDVLRSRGI